MATNTRRWIGIGIMAAAVLAAYFINVEVQSYLGRKALAQTGLTALDLPQALAKAESESKLVLADLSAIWCPSCRKLDQTVLSDPEVRKAIEERFIFARIEYESEEGQAFQERYQVRGFPNLLILHPNGELVKKLPLTFDPAQFQRNLAI